MHPLVIVFLIFACLGVLYYIYLHPALLGTGYLWVRAKIGLGNGQIIGIVAGLFTLYCAYWLVSNYLDSQRRKQARKRSA